MKSPDLAPLVIFAQLLILVLGQNGNSGGGDVRSPVTTTTTTATSTTTTTTTTTYTLPPYLRNLQKDSGSRRMVQQIKYF